MGQSGSWSSAQQKASISKGGKMSQKSIASFFGKPASKKAEGGDKRKVVENGAKTKKDTTSGSVENATKKSQEDKKKKATHEEEDASKENSKNGANTKSGSGSAAAAGGPLPLDAEGLPPLRKTAVNPAFKRKTESETEEPSSNNKVLSTRKRKDAV